MLYYLLVLLTSICTGEPAQTVVEVFPMWRRRSERIINVRQCRLPVEQFIQKFGFDDARRLPVDEKRHPFSHVVGCGTDAGGGGTG